MKRILILFCVLFLSTVVNGQLIKDSTYSYQDLNKLLEIARTNKDQATLADIYRRLGKYEGDVFYDYRRALEYYKWALEYYKLNGDSLSVMNINIQIAKKYVEAGIYDEAISILNNVATRAAAINDTLHLANTYYDLNKAFKARGDHENALQYLEKVEQLNSYIHDTTLLSNILFEKIISFEQSFDIDSALVTAYEVFKINTKTGNQLNIAKSLFHIGYTNKLLNDFPKAIKYLSKGEEIIPYEPYSDVRKFIYKELADTYAKMGNFNKGYAYMQKYTMLNDSILNKNRLTSITNLALKYGSKDKQSSIEILKMDKQVAEEKNKQQRRTLYILAGGLLLVLSSIYFIVKFYNQRITTTKIITEQTQEINQQKIRELEDNIKMSSMRSVIEGQEIERERIAKDLHDSLGALLSTIKLQFDHVSGKENKLASLKEYQHAYSMLDNAVDEVRTISRNLQPGSLQDLGLIPALRDLVNRFEGEAYPDIYFQYYDIPEKIDKMISLSIYRIIQELVNNSLKHANANEILIQINTENDELVIQYEDDGVGFEESKLKRKGMGLENIKSRVNYMHGTMEMNSAEDKGITVLIRIKY